MKLSLESVAAVMPDSMQNWLEVSLWQVRKASMLLFVAFLTIRLIVDFTRSELVGDSTSRAMRKIVWDTATLLALLLFYHPIFVTIDSLVYSIAKIFYNNPELTAAMKVKAKPLAWYNLFGFLQKPFTALLKLFTEGASAALLQRVRALFLLLHLGLGQLSIAVGILPGERSTVRYWFRSTVTIICWIIPMAAIESMYFMLGMHANSSLWLQVALVIVYYKSPSLTSLFLNSTQSSAMATSVTQMLGLAQVSARLSGKAAPIVKLASQKYSPVGAAGKAVKSLLNPILNPKK